MTPQLEQRLREIEEREKNVEPAPWETVGVGVLPDEMRAIKHADDNCSFIPCSHNKTPYLPKHTAEFIAHSRQDIPFLTSELRKAHKALQCAREGLASQISDETLAYIAKILEIK